MHCFMLTFQIESLSPLHGQFNFIFIMTSINIANQFDLSYDQINIMEKKILLNHIENLKVKVTIDYYKISQKMKMKNLVENLQTHDRK